MQVPYNRVFPISLSYPSANRCDSFYRLHPVIDHYSITTMGLNSYIFNQLIIWKIMVYSLPICLLWYDLFFCVVPSVYLTTFSFWLSQAFSHFLQGRCANDEFPQVFVCLRMSLFPLSLLKKSFTGHRSLHRWCFTFSTVNISYQLLLSCMASDEKSTTTIFLVFP